MISIVIPVYNEVESLGPLHAEIAAVADKHQLDLEILFIDDGSKDGSWDLIARLGADDRRIRGIRFRRNFGKAAALNAGFHHSKGDIVITLDGDLQDDPAEIPRFLAALAEGKDVVSGWKRRRLDPWHKVYPSRVFNFMVSWLMEVPLHDHNCGMKAYRREVFREIRLYGELHRFIPVLSAARGFKVGEIEINHRPRKFGYTKYGVRRFVKGFLDLMTVKFLTGFGQRPQHLLGSWGIVFFVLGGLGVTELTREWFVNYFAIARGDPAPYLPLHERPLLIYSVAAILLGAQMMSIGLLAELITSYQGSDEDSYSIAEKVPKEPP
jgi:glycosyltransferase involved in cell wall biosynthesis